MIENGNPNMYWYNVTRKVKLIGMETPLTVEMITWDFIAN